MRGLAAAAAGLLAALVAVSAQPAAPVRPDPNRQAAADGCGRDYFATVRRETPTWVYVNDRQTAPTDPPPPRQWLYGVVDSFAPKFMAVHPTPEDVPLIHHSYDFNFDVLPDRRSAFLLGGDPAAKTGNFAGREEETGRMHVEREQLALPAFAWPELGDRIALNGSWIWDCGHWQPGGERTEIHSYRVLWVERNPRGAYVSPRSASGEAEGDLFISTEKTYAGIEEDCAHRTKGITAAFRACLATEPDWQDVTGSYSFALHAPPRPSANARLTLRVVDRGSRGAKASIRVTRAGSGAVVDVTVASPPGRRTIVAKQIFVGWSPTPARARPEHLRVRFLRLLVRRAMDPGCGKPCKSKETTHVQQQSTAPGEWNVYLDVAGIWRMWSPHVLRARDGQTFPGRQTVDVFVRRGAPWRLFVVARECDYGALGNASGANRALAPCPRTSEIGTADGDDRPGVIVDRFRSPAAALGLHRSNARLAPSSCPPLNRHGCYALVYRVSRVVPS